MNLSEYLYLPGSPAEVSLLVGHPAEEQLEGATGSGVAPQGLSQTVSGEWISWAQLSQVERLSVQPL